MNRHLRCCCFCKKEQEKEWGYSRLGRLYTLPGREYGRKGPNPKHNSVRPSGAQSRIYWPPQITLVNKKYYNSPIRLSSPFFLNTNFISLGTIRLYYHPPCYYFFYIFFITNKEICILYFSSKNYVI